MSTTVYTTRSGRQVKKPVLYESSEICVDDYTDEDDQEEDIQSESECSSEDEEEDADVNGNLTGFVVSDEDDEIDEDEA
jgi:hypothetical protein